MRMLWTRHEASSGEWLVAQARRYEVMAFTTMQTMTHDDNRQSTQTSSLQTRSITS